MNKKNRGNPRLPPITVVFLLREYEPDAFLIIEYDLKDSVTLSLGEFWLDFNAQGFDQQIKAFLRIDASVSFEFGDFFLRHGVIVK